MWNDSCLEGIPVAQFDWYSQSETDQLAVFHWCWTSTGAEFYILGYKNKIHEAIIIQLQCQIALTYDNISKNSKAIGTQSIGGAM